MVTWKKKGGGATKGTEGEGSGNGRAPALSPLLANGLFFLFHAFVDVCVFGNAVVKTAATETKALSILYISRKNDNETEKNYQYFFFLFNSRLLLNLTATSPFRKVSFNHLTFFLLCQLFHYHFLTALLHKTTSDKEKKIVQITSIVQKITPPMFPHNTLLEPAVAGAGTDLGKNV